MQNLFITEVKPKLEAVRSLYELKQIAYDEIKRLNPMNGEREDAMCLILDIAYKFGRNNQQPTT